MNFALLGCDPDLRELALEIARHPEHTLVWAHDVAVHELALRAAAPGLMIAQHWEGLLAPAVADVVLAAPASDHELRAEQLRKLAQAGATLIVSHPVVDSMLIYYELDMIRQEGRAKMIPYVPERWHPVWRRLGEIIGGGATGSLGIVEQIVIEHASPSRFRGDVLRALVRDMEMVRPFCGVLKTVSAMTSAGVRTAEPSIHYGTLSVQMSSSSNLLVRWSVTVVGDPPGSRFTFIGTRGTATLRAPQNGTWRLEAQQQYGTITEEFEQAQVHLAALALPHLLNAIGPSTALHEATAARPAGVPDWLEACRTLDLADAVEHSLERGRSIDLHYETPTEQLTFKGLMSGVGCLLLVAGAAVLIIATSAVNAGVPLAAYWPQILLGVLVLFLLLQSLRLVFPHAPEKRDKG